MKYEGLLTELKSGKVKPFYVFAGEEEYLKGEALGRIKEIVVREGCEDFNYEVLDGKEVDSSGVSSLIDRCRIIPFFGQMRLVAVRNADKICKTKEIKQYADSPIPGACLVLFVQKTVSALKKHEVIFYHPYSSRTGEWIRQKVGEGGKKISSEALHALQEETGNDLGSIAMEIDKLLLFIGGKPRIEDSDVHDVVPPRGVLNIWNLVDAVAEKKKGRALKILKALLLENASPGGVISMIGRQFRFILQAKELMKAGYSSTKIAEEIKYPRGLAGKLIQQTRYFSSAQIKKNFNYLINADLDIKTSRIPAPAVLEILMGRLCSQEGSGLPG